jgi:uncharacterized repeat protein (TIGR03803 family)
MANLSSFFRPRHAALLLTFFLILTHVARAQAQTIEILHNFGVNGGDGDVPYSGLVEDGAGNFYGTTAAGGAHGFGTVYRLSPDGSGGFTETILYSFKGGSTDGNFPHASLFRDSAGDLYGTTVTGGIVAPGCNVGGLSSPEGCGIVFKLTPIPTGQWTETVLHRFSGSDGGNAFSGLIRDAAGNFYGATVSGGSKGLGTVYKLSPTPTGWKETVLHSFMGNPDGALPFVDCATLAMDDRGNIFGSTYVGGADNAGTVFKLSPQTTGAWTEKILYAFKGGSDGKQAFSGVILDKNGNVYGTTSQGGAGGANGGTVFKLSAANNYAKTTLHNFTLKDPAKTFPNALIMDGKGNLYGTTGYALYKLAPGITAWTETVFWKWDSLEVQNGLNLFAPVLMDSHGNFYGTTTWGGQAGSTTGGVAFKVAP